MVFVAILVRAALVVIFDMTLFLQSLKLLENSPVPPTVDMRVPLLVREQSLLANLERKGDRTYIDVSRRAVEAEREKRLRKAFGGAGASA
jgi:hypothetical protein